MEGQTGWVVQGGYLNTEVVYHPQMIIYRSISQAQRRVTTLIDNNASSLSHVATIKLFSEITLYTYITTLHKQDGCNIQYPS